MKLLVFGVSGMLGHKLYQLARDEGHNAYGSMRQSLATFPEGLFRASDICDKVDVRNESDVRRVIAACAPEVVVNCAGLLKPRSTIEEETIEVNSLFPHKLARLCSEFHSKTVQISTDCVFSGSKGNYSEDSAPDPVDLYGRSKLLGEVTSVRNSLTIRTSMIGRELGTRRNLVEWFLMQKGEVRGFTKSIFSGLTTIELSKVILMLAQKNVTGLMHVASQPISKFDLLQLLKKHFRLDDLSIVPFPGESIDRSLTAARLAELEISVPSWDSMVHGLAKENQFYAEMNRRWQRES